MHKIIDRYIAITLFGLAVILLIEYLGFFEGFNNYLYDLSFRIRGAQQHSERIIIAAVDEKTLERLGRWPIRRSYYGRFLDKVNEAAVVGFDIILAETSEDDPMLAEAIKRHGRVILPVYFDSNLNPVYATSSFEPRSVGHIHVEPDIDGVVRKVFHSIHAGDLMVHSFTSVIYETVTADKIARQKVQAELSGETGQKKLLQTDPMHINYSGPAGTFETLSFVDILEGKYPPQFFKNKIVLVGLTAIGLEDRILTPFSQQRNRMAGVEGHAHILNNLFSANDINVGALWIRWISFIALSLFVFFVFMKLTEKKATLLWLFCLIFISISVYAFFSNMNLWLSPALLYVSITFMYGATYLIRLDEAVRRLDREYSEVAAQLRWEKAGTIKAVHRRGLVGFLSAGGINAKIRILTEIIDQLLFEKKLIDAALLSDIQGVMLFNPAGKLIVENERARAIFHALSIKIATLDDFYQDLFPYIIKDETTGDAEKINPEFGANVTSTLFFSAPENKYLKMDTSLIPFNQAQYLLCTFTDVTRIKEMELLKGRIVSTVSHELKQPLTVIQGLVELLRLSLTGKEGKYAEIINNEVQRMVQFITRFLDISRLESGREHIRKEPVDMVDILRQALPLFKALAAAKGIHMKVRMPDKTTAVMLDRDLTKQSIINLVENAIKYSPPGKDVMVELTELTSGLRIDVIDNGYGMEEGELRKIFVKFYRGKTAIDNGSRGSGLGLAFVKEAVESQGGTISVRSVPGEGSTFSLVFPAG